MYPTRHVPHWRILLVDDSFSTRELVSMILGCHGCIVSTASNGAEALEKLRSHARPDLIVLDLIMPVMDGWAFSEEIGGDEQLASIPVIILSAAEHDKQLAAKLKAPFLRKPVETGDLLHAIEETCGGCRPAEPKQEVAAAGPLSGMG